MGLALWLVPTVKHEKDILQQEMDSLRLANADIASASFPPHVTLIAGLAEQESGSTGKAVWEAFLKGLAQWREDAKIDEGTPFQCTLESVTTRGLYFQCIVLALRKNSSLVSLNDQMRRTFSLESQPEYFPHCSLLYAPLSAQEGLTKIKDMHRRKVWEAVAAEEAVVFGSGTFRLSSITLGRIELWNCNGPVSEWKQIEVVLL